MRLVPQEVAVQIASSGFNSPTEKLTDFRSVATPQGLAWTAFRSPDGAFRVFSKKSQGFVTLNAESTERRVTQSDAEFEVAPGQLLTDNLRWRLLKRHYLIDLANPVGALDRAGRPIIIVPYVSYKGWLIRRPVLGGVFVVHPDGEIEDLSPDEARQAARDHLDGTAVPGHARPPHPGRLRLQARDLEPVRPPRGADPDQRHREQSAALPDRLRRARPQMGDRRGAVRPGLRRQCDLPDGHGHRADRDLARAEQRQPQRQPPRGRHRAVGVDPRRRVRRRGGAGNGRQVQGRGAAAGVRARPAALPRVGDPGERQLRVEERGRGRRAQQGGGDLRQRHRPLG